MTKSKDNHQHLFSCSDIPGYYFCKCGAEGSWNRNTRRIEVLKKEGGHEEPK
jgi:hypothetical protein